MNNLKTSARRALKLASFTFLFAVAGQVAKAQTVIDLTTGLTPAELGSKFDKYVTPTPIEKGPVHGPWVDFQGYKYEGKPKVRLVYRYLTKDVKMLTSDHAHDKFSEFIMFFGSDSKDINSMDCEIEFCIGKGSDQEKFVINKPMNFHFAKNIPHGPLEFRKVNKPVTMVIVCDTERYDVPHMGH